MWKITQKGYYDMELNLEQAKSILKDKVFETRKGEVLAEKAIDIVLTELERLQKENEELREYYEEQNEVNAKFIPVQKVKYKIEELEEEKEEYYSQYKIDELNDKILVLQELLGKE